jgi:hypothetical protein
LRSILPFVRIHFVTLAAVLVLCAADVSFAAGKKQLPTIRIIEATYGANCQNVSKGNVTRFVASQCNDKTMCNYRVYYKHLEEEPPSGCERNFSVRYACGRSFKSCTVDAEAAWGGDDGHPNKFCMMYCQ